jgi:hypothetical protein
MKAFYETLLARHHAKLQVLVALAQKLIHAIYGVFYAARLHLTDTNTLPGTFSRINRRPSPLHVSEFKTGGGAR